MSLGKIGEEKARKHIEKAGFKVLGVNYTRRPLGEIDIVAERDGVLCFVEVKTSRYFAKSGFSPEIRVNRKKVSRLKRICEAYLREHDSFARKWRIDVISVILGERNEVVKLDHFENAVFAKQY